MVLKYGQGPLEGKSHYFTQKNGGRIEELKYRRVKIKTRDSTWIDLAKNWINFFFATKTYSKSKLFWKISSVSSIEEYSSTDFYGVSSDSVWYYLGKKMNGLIKCSLIEN